MGADAGEVTDVSLAGSWRARDEGKTVQAKRLPLPNGILPDGTNRIILLYGLRSALRRRLMLYCFERFESERIWLVDSAQVFDPYLLSRRDAARARRALLSMRVSRPFTLYQLRDKVAELGRLPLTRLSTVIISSLDCFTDDAADDKERAAIMDRMLKALRATQKRTECCMILGLRDSDAANSIMARLPALVFAA